MPEITVLPHDVRATARTDETVVDALRRAGWRGPYRCRRGGCGACKVHLVEGLVRYSEPVADSVLDAVERAAGLCLPCRAVPVTDVVLDVGAAPLRAILATAPPWRV